jgi:hypothetical protein
MPALLPPTRMRLGPAKSGSLLLGGPDGPACGASTWTTPALRRSYRARGDSGRNQIRITKVSTVLGEPRDRGLACAGGVLHLVLPHGRSSLAVSILGAQGLARAPREDFFA